MPLITPPAPAELALIERIRRAVPGRVPAVRLGIGDDCAILRVPRGHELLVTTDFSLEGRHFRRDWHSPESTGHRCLARGLSDIASMGGKPLAAFLSLALPPGFDPAWLDRFLAGFNALASRSGVELAGGDTAQAPGEHILADIVLTGAVPATRALRRSGATPGNLIYVSGTLGGSAAELARMAAGEPGPTHARTKLGRGNPHPQSFPEPRLKLGTALRTRRLATACMDLSDGLSSDLRHLCDASGVAAEIELAALPTATGATRAQALHGGEDYELLFTANPQTRVPRRLAGVALWPIGRILQTMPDGAVVTTVDQAGRREALSAAGWEHFR